MLSTIGISVSAFFYDINWISFAKKSRVCYFQKKTLVMSKECIESNVALIEAKKFLEKKQLPKLSLVHQQLMTTIMKKILYVEYLKNFLPVTS